jgi:predicted outer membrane repeat protein
VSQSQFTGNTGNLIVAPPGTTTTITSTTFVDNAGATPLLASGTVSITAGSFVGTNVRSFFSAPCQLTIDSVTFEGNANGALWADCASITITNSMFANNTGQGIGGAILLFSGAQQTTLRADRFLGNTAPQGGGAIMLAPATADRSLVIDHTAFTGNQSGGAGGAIDIPTPAVASARTTVALRHVSFSRNTAAGAGGAIEGSGTEVEATQTVFADNQAKLHGGAVALVNAAPLHSVFANSLFIRNVAPTGSAYSADDADFINVTVDSNEGLAIESRAPGPAAPIRLTNTIVSNNPKRGCGAAGPPGREFVDGGHNLQFPATDCGASIPVADPHLDTLYIPVPLSPPLGHGDLAVCMARPIGGRDVYGSARPSGGACAIGAAEGPPPNLVPCQRPGPDQPDIRSCYRNAISQLQKMLPGSH